MNRPATNAIVTGANRGLGLQVCRELAREGLHVVMTSRDADAGARSRARLADEGLAVDCAVVDVTRPDTYAVLLDAGELDVVVHNAGVALSGFDAEIARSTIETNTYGPLRLTRVLLPRLRDGARVVMVSSGMGELTALGSELRARFAAPAITTDEVEELTREFIADVQAGRHRERGWPSSAYRVSKAALNSLTRVLAREHPRLRINAVCPGWVRTDLGGGGAPRSVEEGAAGIVWATHVAPDGPTGCFFRDGAEIPW